MVDSGVEVSIPEVETVEVNPLVGRSSGVNGDGFDFDCFILNLPFGVLLDDGTEITISENFQFDTLFFNEENFVVDFVYPLTVTLEDGSIVSVDDGIALAELFASCVPDNGWEDGDFPAYQISDENSCYVLQYPVDIIDIDGNILTAADEIEFNAAIAEEIYFFIWPLTLIDGEETIVVNNVEEMFEALLSCNFWEEGDSTIWDWNNGFEYIGCYMIEFPLEVIVDGETVTVGDHQELCSIMLQGNLEGYAYPLTLISEEGLVVVVNNEAELNAQLDECWDYGGYGGFEDVLLILYFGAIFNDGNPEACYNIQFPISIDSEDTPTTIFNNLEELGEAISSSSYFCCLVFPVTVILNSDQSVSTIENVGELYEVIENCN